MLGRNDDSQRSLPPARKSAAPPENLHIAAIQRIVGKHRNKTTAGRLNPRDLARMRDQLEHATGLSIAEIADLTNHWPA